MQPVFIVALLMLVWGTFAFGGVYPWASAPLAVGCATVAILGWLRRGDRAADAARELGPWLGLLLAAAALQLLPLPLSVVQAVSPGAGFFLARDTAFRAAGWSQLSLVPRLTLEVVGWWGCLGLLFAGLTRLTDPSQIRRLVGLVVLVGWGLAVVALAQGSQEWVYGEWQPKYVAQPMGPFINRNHFAGWMLLALGLGGGLFGHLLERRREATAGLGWRQRFVRSTGAEGSQLVLLTFGMLTMGVALVVCLSRSGLLGGVVLLAVLGGCATVRGRRIHGAVRVGGVVAAVVVVAGALAWAGLQPLARRFAEADRGMHGRLDAWRDAVGMVPDFPLAGTGLGTFGLVLPRYRTVADGFLEAHNDYLQLLTEGGALVVIPAFLLLIQFGRTIVRRLRLGDEHYWMRAGAAAGLLALAAQELVEFSLRSPAVAVLLTIACTVAVHDVEEWA